jgi:hypothetical protein
LKNISVWLPVVKPFFYALDAGHFEALALTVTLAGGARSVSASAKIPIVPVEKVATRK